MAFNYKYVLNPTGQVDNHILREMFEDVKTELALKAYDADVVHDTGNETVAGNKTFTGVTTVNGLNGTFIGLGRNRIINGDMVIDQRNEGASAAGASGNVFSADRWYASMTGTGRFSAQKQTSTVPTGFLNAIALTVTTNDTSIAASDFYAFQQNIEGLNLRDFLLGSASAVTFTLSFWVRSSLTGTYGVGFNNSAFNRAYVGQYTINAANTWEQKTITVAGDTTGTWLTTIGVGMRIIWDLGSGTDVQQSPNTWVAGAGTKASGNVSWIGTNGATFYLSGVQLEIGSTATNFEYVPFPELLQKCQRYYEKSYAYGVALSTNTAVDITRMTAALLAATTPETGTVTFKVEKRSTSSVSLISKAGTAGKWEWFSNTGVATERTTTVQSGGVGTRGFDVFQTAAAELWTQGHWTADAEL